MTITDEQLLQLVENRLNDAESVTLRAQIANDDDASRRLRLMEASQGILSRVEDLSLIHI